LGLEQDENFTTEGINLTAANDAYLLNQDIKYMSKKTMRGLILLSCNAGHIDYIDTKVGNVAMAFSEVVNGAPVIASDGTVQFYKETSSAYENIYESIVDREFIYFSATGLLASEKFDLGYVTRESNKGWLIYKKEGNKVNYTEVNRNKYLNYTATSKSLTFTNLLEQL